ncbi:hypothetical protein A3709_20695 [Halioglobus sp. HI00S01]|uniref:ParB/RepB/Spo0J family partition protein n=1 Tax=Halioglobus sp. HI00S01 TaxID=1822214 RepID=UPI0007C29554|nr:hypothetical protein [Halioglobus sp. HI00S01]KZX58033.1 hypothetical protein A3709_20695 [Halioglobus sp. HI00S01]
MPIPTGQKTPTTAQNLERAEALRSITYTMTDVDPDLVEKAPFAIKAHPTRAQIDEIKDVASDLGTTPGINIARYIEGPDGEQRVQLLTGIERYEAGREVQRFAKKIPLRVIPEMSDSDAVYYAIEYAYRDHKHAEFSVSHVDYALAARNAISHFSRPGQQLPVQALANALCLSRSVLSNRLRLLTKLDKEVIELLNKGRIGADHAKILTGEKSAMKQISLARRVATGGMTTRKLYQAVNPNYEAPQLVSRRRRVKKTKLGDVGAMERKLEETYGTQAQISINTTEGVTAVVDLRFVTFAVLKGIVEKLDGVIQDETVIEGDLSFYAKNPRDTDRLLEELGATEDSLE